MGETKMTWFCENCQHSINEHSNKRWGCHECNWDLMEDDGVEITDVLKYVDTLSRMHCDNWDSNDGAREDISEKFEKLKREIGLGMSEK